MTDRPRVIVTDYDFLTLTPEQEVIERAGFELVPTQSRTEDELIANCRSADALLVEYAQVTRRVVMSLERCRVIVRYGVGFDNLDIAAATDHGIWACNVPDYCIDEVSDHALALLLAQARKIVALSKAVHDGRWDIQVGKPIFRLQDQALGLLGIGRIGSALARKVSAIGCRILAYDPLLSPEQVRQRGAEPMAFEALMRQADYISVHLPLAPETRHLIDERSLKLMKRTAVLINTSRGPLVDSYALAKALREGWIGGAALDVLEEEPMEPDHPLIGLPNCLITPHAAYYSEQSFFDLKTRAAEEVVRVLEGGEPRNPLNPEVREAAAKRYEGYLDQHGGA